MAQFCPVTGFKVFSHPGWMNQKVSETLEANFWTIGDAIVYSRPKGIADLEGVQHSMVINDEVIKSIINKQGSYVQIEDYASLKGSTNDARRLFAKNMQVNNPLALFFCNVTLPLSMAIKIGRRLTPTNNHIHVGKSYREAVQEALGFISKEALTVDAGLLEICKSFNRSECSLSCVDLFSENTWQIKTPGYSNQVAMVDKCILHSIPEGYFEPMHIPLIEHAFNQIRSDLPEDSAIQYMVVDASRFKGGSRAGRIQFLEWMNRFHRQSPLRMYVVYHGNTFMKTALHMAKPFMPFKVRVAKDIYQAFQFIQNDRDRMVPGPPELEEDFPLTITQKDIDNLMHLVGSINWENGRIPNGGNMEEGHPFYFLYQSIKLIKEELDHLFVERKQEEGEKIKAQAIAGEQRKLALVGQIAGKMAHDFNNILGIIMGNVELSLLDCRETETRQTLELILDQTLRGKNLTKNLVAFAKDQDPRYEFFRINEKMDLVFKLMKKDLEGIELIRENKPDIPDLLADPGMIEHALVNLVQNAIHATSKVEQPRINIRTYCWGDKICFEIEDNGCGILEKDLEYIYEPSFTLKGSQDTKGSYEPGIKGTGYGLANVKKYIEQHRGEIFVYSKFGVGTKFTIHLPVMERELTPREKEQIQQGGTYRNRHILLVEDEPDISDIQCRILTQDPCQHTVDRAKDGQTAIALYEKNFYDFVSLDYSLPGKINGMDVYHHIRAIDKNILILFVSGNIDFLESIKELKQKDPYLDHLSKPFRNKEYVNRINRLLGKRLTVKELA